jgi:Tfp pilus assembly protein PilV
MLPITPPPTKLRRRAVTILEVTVALALLAFGLVMTAQLLGLAARQRHAAGQLLVAQLEAANALERIAAMPYDRITSESLGNLTLSNDAKATLADGQLKANVETATDSGPRHKRITVEVAWPIGEGPARTVELTSWKYDLP